MVVKYLWYDFKNKLDDDLVCELTAFMDEYLLHKGSFIKKTYIYNDLNKSDDGTYRVAFRVPGATRGGIRLERIDRNKFKIIDFHFYDDVMCYREEIKEDVNKYIGEILDFSEVKLNNNKEE